MVRRILRWVVVGAGSALLGLALIAATLYWRFLHGGPELEPWHRVMLQDFSADQADDVLTFAAYQRLEERLFADLLEQVYAGVEPADRVPFNRYSAGSASDPLTWAVNWNRSFRMTPSGDVPGRGAVLLLHGLTDSPYSLRSVGAHLAARGYEVVGLRLPGHGTAPSGLLSFRVEDLQAAVRLVARDLAQLVGPDRPLYLVGYSNGAALAVDYALSVLEGEDLPRPAGLVLISPAIGVSPLAAIARLRTGLSGVPGFRRAAWQAIETEFDPFKYSSFSFHAAGQTHRLTRGVARRLTRLAAGDSLRGFPPVLAFLSTVDATVRAEALADVLLGRLAAEGHELVLFDVNRHAAVQSLLVEDPGPLTRQLLAVQARPYALSVLTNATPGTFQVMELHAPAGAGRQASRLLDLAWPRAVFSLSHVALPFPPDDPLYGYAAHDDVTHVQLGRVEVRGENGVLAVPSWLLTRQRSNPFHAYLLERMDRFLQQGATAP
jgi:alpha-beta hydrolase superfamily lysophospholipase